MKSLLLGEREMALIEISIARLELALSRLVGGPVGATVQIQKSLRDLQLVLEEGSKCPA